MSNLVYCISCSRCGLLYVGETGRRLSDRFAEHLRSVRNGDADKSVARHFNSANHSLSDIKVCAISQISGSNNNRKRQEKRLIFKIGTIHPHGLKPEPFTLLDWFVYLNYTVSVCTKRFLQKKINNEKQ